MASAPQQRRVARLPCPRERGVFGRVSIASSAVFYHACLCSLCKPMVASKTCKRCKRGRPATRPSKSALARATAASAIFLPRAKGWRNHLLVRRPTNNKACLPRRLRIRPTTLARASSAVRNRREEAEMVAACGFLARVEGREADVVGAKVVLVRVERAVSASRLVSTSGTRLR